ncbi:MAG: RagB/SusD family nutrient uptake outer membrane protein [Carboxylicivirga sp.]|jgi:tetratricopeptide (TPR) repeat protein|nr:RagB/SusD family nutrient uptake outer membrane protein [Carboxylicivirga sp.]
MNKILLYTVLAIWALSSCSDFLEKAPQDQVIPKTTRDYSEFVFGEIYPGYKVPNDYYLDIMSDDVSEFIGSYGKEYRLNMFGYYTWQKEPEFGLGDEVQYDKAWDTYYHRILLCNMVLNEAPKIDGAEAEVEAIKGECYFLRAHSYFMLINLYGLPYNKATAKDDLGVPINDNIGVNDQIYTRSSVQEVYDRINTDIEASADCLKKSGVKNTVFRITEAAACVLASRIYLHQSDFDKVIEYSNRGLNINPTLYNLLEHDAKKPFMSFSNSEIIFTFGMNTTSSFYAKYTKASFAASQDLLNLYDDSDERKEKYYQTSSGRTRPLKGFSNTLELNGFSMRVSELFLNRAEAYAAKTKVELALKDINYLRSFRCNANVDLSATSDDILDVVREERRRELSFEQQRWFDLRRYGMPEIKHTWTSDLTTKESKKFVLKEKDGAYTLPVPLDIRSVNKQIINVNRPER